ncbi:hypothetical protein PInf_012806 [Phytophthora infestans]|nr:hypothetical protein PInf_012806 [Phytophthora infestans]
MQRDVVRAVRRGVLVYILGRVWSWVFGGSDVELATTESGFFSLHSSRVTFQVTTSFMENLAILSAASVFRILLFRASHQVVGGAFGGPTTFATSPQNVTPLNEQYLHGLHNRMDAAVKKISDKKTPKVPADAEDVEILDKLAHWMQIRCNCARTLFTSRDRWNALFNSTTAVVDGFTLMLQLLNTLPDRKGDTGDNAPAGALALEQSFGALLRFLNTQQDAHPLLLLQQYPHLASLRISSSSVKSSIKFFFESKLQFAVRRFLMEEARRRVFQRTKVVRAAESLLCHLVSVSRAEDKQGIVQHTVPAVVSSLLECRNALDAYMETCLKESSTTDVYVQEATALAKGIDSGIYRITEVFQGELSLFAFPPGVKKALLAYASLMLRESFDADDPE